MLHVIVVMRDMIALACRSSSSGRAAWPPWHVARHRCDARHDRHGVSQFIVVMRDMIAMACRSSSL
jgi:hypothetical protein